MVHIAGFTDQQRTTKDSSGAYEFEFQTSIEEVFYFTYYAYTRLFDTHQTMPRRSLNNQWNGELFHRNYSNWPESPTKLIILPETGAGGGVEVEIAAIRSYVIM